jgi:hypothetical protein
MAPKGRQRKFKLRPTHVGVIVIYPAHHIRGMDLELDDDQTTALIKELADIVENDPYPFSPRIGTLRDILSKLRPEPVREPMPPRKVYAPPKVFLELGTSALLGHRYPTSWTKHERARLVGWLLCL